MKIQHNKKNFKSLWINSSMKLRFKWIATIYDIFITFGQQMQPQQSNLCQELSKTYWTNQKPIHKRPRGNLKTSVHTQTHSLAHGERASGNGLRWGFVASYPSGEALLFSWCHKTPSQKQGRDAAQLVPDTTSKSSYLPLRESRTGTLSSCSCGEFCLLFTLSWSLSTSTDIRQGTHDRRRRRLLLVLLAPWRTNAPLAL